MLWRSEKEDSPRVKSKDSPSFNMFITVPYLMLVWINQARTFSQLSKRSYSVFGRALWMANFITFYDTYEALLFQGSLSFKVNFISQCLLLREIYFRKYIRTFPCSLYLFDAYFGCWCVGIQSQTKMFVSQQCCAPHSDIARNKCNPLSGCT
jgi:hypothetical protein